MRIVEPTDGWGMRDGKPIIPRKWQARELPRLISHFRQPNPSRAVVYAGTGSGKSILLAQLCAWMRRDKNETLVVSTSRQRLVKQIMKDIKNRLESDEFMAEEIVGSYWAESKQANSQVVVCCNDSLENLAMELERLGRTVPMYFCDELHRSESKSMKRAYERLRPTMACGFSATPFLAKESREISNFDEVVSHYTVGEALEDKVIVPWEVRAWEGREVDRDVACLEMMRACGGRGVVNADNIVDAEDFSKYCTEKGYSVSAVHSKQPEVENNRIIEEMRTGKIQCICHIDTLSEGVDLPHVAHLTLRRVVGSRNRFVQELGRGIRAYIDEVTGEAKERLIVNDPHDLFGVFRVAGYEAVLSGDGDPDDATDDSELSEGERLERTLQQECFSVMRHLVKAKNNNEPVQAEVLASYLSNLVSVFDTFRLLDRKISARDWRRAPASEKQVQAMQSMKCWLSRACVPQLHQTALKALTDFGTKMNRGMASDLISIEASLAEKKTWPNFSQLDKIAREGLQRHEKKRSGGVAPGLKPHASGAPDMAATPQKLDVIQGLLFDDMGAKKK